MTTDLQAVIFSNFASMEAVIVIRKYAEYYTDYGNVAKKTFIKRCRCVLAQELEDRIAAINEHREAVGRNPFPNTIGLSEIQVNEDLIDCNAPYGVDPWEGC